MDIKNLHAAMEHMNKMGIHGKDYTMVAQRVEAFRKFAGTDWSITSEILEDNGNRVLMRATITDRNGFIVSDGLAEEIRGHGVNKTSAIENAQTSAWGRALAALGLHGGKMASVDEITIAKNKDKIIDAEQEHDDAVRAERNEGSTGTSQKDLEILAERIKDRIKDAKQTWQLKKIPEEFVKEFEAIQKGSGNLAEEIMAYHKTRWEQLNDGIRR
jgi:autotransporter adhesin